MNTLSVAAASPADFVVLEDPDGNLFCVVQKDAHDR
jgi:hypothetical protein